MTPRQQTLMEVKCSEITDYLLFRVLFFQYDGSVDTRDWERYRVSSLCEKSE